MFRTLLLFLALLVMFKFFDLTSIWELLILATILTIYLVTGGKK